MNETGRLEAFSDGVIAVIITIMVLELRAPAGHDFKDLKDLAGPFLAYGLSFVMVAIYWNNHHHLFRAANRATPAIMWSNMALLFSLSLIPFGTSWLGEGHASIAPTVTYAVLLLAPALCYYLLVQAIMATNEDESEFKKRVGSDVKGRVSLVIYLLAIPAAFISTWISIACFVAVAAIWIIPDRRFETG